MLALAAERFAANPKLGLLYGNCVFIDADSQFLRYFVEVEPYDRYRLLNCSDYIMQPTTFFRRELLADFTPSTHYTEAFLLVEGLYRAQQRGARIVEVPVSHRPRPHGASRCFTWRTARRLAWNTLRGAVVGRLLGRYAAERNHPDENVTSGLSPYLHFGHISAHQVLGEVLAKQGWSAQRLDLRAAGQREG